MAKVTITVNGKALQVDPANMLIQELLSNGISVPHFCYHEALGLDGNCRMCMVEIVGQKRPQIACNTPIKAGMQISTQSPMIMQVKRSILELELINHPVDCPICDQAGECSLQEYYMEVGLHESRIDIAHKVKKAKHIDLGGNVILDQERCVLCTRCTRFTANITKTHDLIIANRGNHACVTTFADRPLEAKGYAMNVVDLCPVGALTSKDFRFAQRVWFLTSDKSICHGCSRGCNIFIDHNRPKYQESRIYRFRPRKNLLVNGHFICDAGRLSYKELNENRLTTAIEGTREIKIESALKIAAQQLEAQQNKTLAVLSPSLSLEEIAAIDHFASAHQIDLFAVESRSYDESFADDMLKTADRASNRAGVRLLGISEDKESLAKALDGAALVLNFANLDYLERGDSQTQRWIHFTARRVPLSALQIPIKAFSEQEGMLVNFEGVLQKYHSQIEKSYMLFDLPNLLGAIASQGYETPRISELLKTKIAALKDLEIEEIPPEGIQLEPNV